VQHGKQCKKHELMACVCSACQTNFCLAHRHPSDHDCAGPRAAANKAATAAASRAGPSSGQSKMTEFFRGPFRSEAQAAPAARPSGAPPGPAWTRGPSGPGPAAAAALNRQEGRGSTPGRPLVASATPRQLNGMSEDEALAAALAASLGTSSGPGSQEEEDRALARALQESEALARRGQAQGAGQGEKSCALQ
jgi:hypothetical protein